MTEAGGRKRHQTWLLFLCLFCVVVYLVVAFVVIDLFFFSTKPRHWLVRKAPK